MAPGSHLQFSLFPAIILRGKVKFGNLKDAKRLVSSVWIQVNLQNLCNSFRRKKERERERERERKREEVVGDD